MRGVRLKAGLAAATGLAMSCAPTLARATPVLEGERGSLDIGGDLKSFFHSVHPYSWELVYPEEVAAFTGEERVALMPEEAIAQGALDGRLKIEGRLGEHLRLSAHARSAGTVYSQPLEAGFFALGSSGGTPEAVDMSWEPIDDSGYRFEGRVDRLNAVISIPHLDLTLGRQPVSFGSTFFFNPMDLVAPFSPMVVDQEYKPGIDALRADAYFGISGQVTAVAAYAGDWDLEGSVLALHGKRAFGTTDMGLFLALNHAEPVVGLDMSGSIGTVAVRSEATMSFPEDEEEIPFARIALGGDYMFSFPLTLSGEIYAQTFGGADPSEYLALYDSERFARGEIWAVGRLYAGLALDYELTPLVHVNSSLVANLGDPSMLLGPGLSWSVADNAEVVAGAFFGLGQRPRDVELELEDFESADPAASEEEYEAWFEELLTEKIDPGSEFGMVPAVAYLQMKMYF